MADSGRAPGRSIMLVVCAALALTLGACASGGATVNTVPVAQGSRYVGPYAWGGLDRLAGRRFSWSDWTISSDGWKSFRWEVPGEVLVVEQGDSSNYFGSSSYTLDPATGVVVGYQLHSDGSLVSDHDAVSDGKRIRLRMRVINDHQYEDVVEELNGTTWQVPFMGRTVYTSNEQRAANQRERDNFWSGLAGGLVVAANAYAQSSAASNQTCITDASGNRSAGCYDYLFRDSSGNRIAAVAQPSGASSAPRERASSGSSGAGSEAAARRREEAERREADRREAEQRAESETASLNAAQADLASADVERVRIEAERAEARRAEDARREEAERIRRNEAEARERRAAEERAARERREAEAREARERARAAAEAERNRLIDFPEVIVLCSLEGSQGERGNWRCQGGLQTTYAKLDTAEAALPLGQACGTRSPPRELGSTGGYRAFGCGFGMVRGGVGAYSDPAARLGVGYVPNRAIFSCPASRSGDSCRNR